MNCRLIFGLFGALILTSQAHASEDMPDIIFGAEEEIFNSNDFMGDDAGTQLSAEELNKLLADVPPAAPELEGMPAIQPAPEPTASPQPIAETVPDAAATEAPMPNVAKGQNLTDTLKSDTATAQPHLPLPKVEGTWVNKLATSNPLEILNADKSKSGSLESLVNDARKADANAKKSNASVFDISGVMLRMSLAQTDEIMQNRGFRKIMQKYQVPNFIKWRNEEFCRNIGVVGYERIENCVIDKAKKDKQQYVQITKYTKFDTKEEVEVTFTSNFTENKVYKISYTSQASNITGNSQKAVYLRNIKIYDFWKKINQKYGKPDDKEAVTWGMGDNKPYLKAKTGFLLLEDPMLRELDYTRMSREDQRYLNTDLYSF